MKIRSVVFLAGLAAAGLVGQIGSNTVTVSASRDVWSQENVAGFYVTVNGAIDQTVDDVIRALAGSGITAGNLSQVSYGSYLPAVINQQLIPIVWGFQWAVPLNRIKDTTASLTALQGTVSQRNPKLRMTFGFSGSQPSPQQASCDIAGLVGDARAQAQKLAGAAGLVAAAVVGIEGAIDQGSIAQSAGGCALNVTFALGYSGQPGPHTITIGASRTAVLPRDRMRIGLTVTSGDGVGLDEVMRVLADAGISGAAFSSVYSSPNFTTTGNTHPTPTWQFSFTAPLAKLNDTLRQLMAAQQTILKQNPGFGLMFGASLQPAAQSSVVCSDADLIGDAKAMAQKMAGAAGVSVGGIVGLGKGSVGGYSASFLSGIYDPVTVCVVWPSFAAPSYSSEPGCGVTVQFGLY